MRFLILSSFIFFGCNKVLDNDYRVVKWEMNYADLESNILVDTSKNLGSTQNLHRIYQIEYILDSEFIAIADKGKYENDTIEIELRNKGFAMINNKPIEIFKLICYSRPNPIVGEAVIYNPDVGLIMYTHSHTKKRFYHKNTQLIQDGIVVDSIHLDYNNDKIFEFYFSDVEIPEIDKTDYSEIEDSIVLDLNIY